MCGIKIRKKIVLIDFVKIIPNLFFIKLKNCLILVGTNVDRSLVFQRMVNSKSPVLH